MAETKQGKTQNGETLHYSVGALIQKDDAYLLIDRAIPPFGFASVAGHIDLGEAPEEALVREVYEEVGLVVTDKQLLFREELNWNTCSLGVDVHDWHLYACTTAGKVKRSEEETKSVGWYTADEMKSLTLEPVWEYWFKKLKIL